MFMEIKLKGDKYYEENRYYYDIANSMHDHKLPGVGGILPA